MYTSPALRSPRTMASMFGDEFADAFVAGTFVGVATDGDDAGPNALRAMDRLQPLGNVTCDFHVIPLVEHGGVRVRRCSFRS